ncbi:MAG: hypothetical protein ACI89J_004401, partial [Hyphomicrobiaceae bacterium]
LCCAPAGEISIFSEIPWPVMSGIEGSAVMISARRPAGYDPDQTQCGCATLMLHQSPMLTGTARAPQHSARYGIARRRPAPI